MFFKQLTQKIVTVLPVGIMSTGAFVGPFSACPFSLPFYAGVFAYACGEKGGAVSTTLSLIFGGLLLASLIYALRVSWKARQYINTTGILIGAALVGLAKLWALKILLYLGLAIFVICVFRTKKYKTNAFKK